MGREIKPKEEYLGRLLKLIPSEIVAAYMAIQGIIPKESAKWGLTVISVILLIITPYYLKTKQKVGKKSQVLISTLSFIVWLYAIGGPFKYWNIQIDWVSSVIMVFWTMLVPQFFKPETDAIDH